MEIDNAGGLMGEGTVKGNHYQKIFQNDRGKLEKQNSSPKVIPSSPYSSRAHVYQLVPYVSIPYQQKPLQGFDTNFIPRILFGYFEVGYVRPLIPVFYFR